MRLARDGSVSAYSFSDGHRRRWRFLKSELDKWMRSRINSTSHPSAVIRVLNSERRVRWKGHGFNEEASISTSPPAASRFGFSGGVVTLPDGLAAVMETGDRHSRTSMGRRLQPNTLHECFACSLLDGKAIAQTNPTMGDLVAHYREQELVDRGDEGKRHCHS